MSSRSSQPITSAATASAELDDVAVPFRDVKIPPFKAERADPTEPLGYRYGYEVSYLFNSSWIGYSFNMPWQETIAALREGIEVSVDCAGETPEGILHALPRPNPNNKTLHRLHLRPNGHITMVDHPEYTNPAGGSSEHLDFTSERFLHAIGGDLPPCAAITLCLISEQLDPSKSWNRLLGFTHQHGAVPAYMSNYRVKTLYSAVAWAQQPCWPTDAGNRFFKAGTTPQVLDYWLQQGWTVEAAVDFLSNQATFDNAEQWRAAGDTSHRAAILSGLNQHPEDEKIWTNLGFKHGAADEWRMPPPYGGSFTPEEAWYWHSHGISRTVAKDLRSMPETKEAAAVRNANRPKPASTVPTSQSDPVISHARAFEWVKAGVPDNLVWSWYRTIEDDLPTVLTWAGTIPARRYKPFADYNAAHPHRPITPAHVIDLRRYQVPVDVTLIGIAVEAGLSGADIDRVISMLTVGKRWLGIELREVLSTAIGVHLTASVAEDKRIDGLETISRTDYMRDRHRRATSSTGYWEGMQQAVQAGNFEPVVTALRSTRSMPNSPSVLWGTVLEWFATHPSPKMLASMYAAR